MKKILYVFPSIATLLIAQSAAGQSGNACDLNKDNVVNSADVQLIVNMTLGITTCTADILAPRACSIVAVQRVVNAALGGQCLTGNLRTVSLNWVASTSVVAGYNVYRATVSGGPYTKINSTLVVATTFSDTVAAGQTYYYVATAVDARQNESVYSNVATAVVSSP